MEKHPLAVLREYLLAQDNPAHLLTVADGYLNSMVRMGDSFVLPAEHAELKPILEYYAGDLPGWLKYVRKLRDLLGKEDSRWRAVYELYRLLEVREVQRWRRERLNAAVAMAVSRRLIEDNADAKRRYANRCTQEWMKMRTALLDGARRKSHKGRLSEEERSELLASFWNDVDELISQGELPAP